MIHLGILGVGSETDGCKGYITDHSLTLSTFKLRNCGNVEVFSHVDADYVSPAFLVSC